MADKKKCEHRNSVFNTDTQSMICLKCGEEHHQGLSYIQQFAKEHPELETNKLINTNIH